MWFSKYPDVKKTFDDYRFFGDCSLKPIRYQLWLKWSQTTKMQLSKFKVGVYGPFLRNERALLFYGRGSIKPRGGGYIQVPEFTKVDDENLQRFAKYMDVLLEKIQDHYHRMQADKKARRKGMGLADDVYLESDTEESGENKDNQLLLDGEQEASSDNGVNIIINVKHVAEKERKGKKRKLNEVDIDDEDEQTEIQRGGRNRKSDVEENNDEDDQKEHDEQSNNNNESSIEPPSKKRKLDKENVLVLSKSDENADSNNSNSNNKEESKSRMTPVNAATSQLSPINGKTKRISTPKSTESRKSPKSTESRKTPKNRPSKSLRNAKRTPNATKQKKPRFHKQFGIMEPSGRAIPITKEVDFQKSTYDKEKHEKVSIFKKKEFKDWQEKKKKAKMVRLNALYIFVR